MDDLVYQPRRAGEILGAGFSVYRDNMADLLRISALVAIPALLLEAVMSLAFAHSTSTAGVLARILTALAISAVGIQIVLAGTVRFIGSALVGNPVSWLDSWRYLKANIGLLITALLAELIFVIPIMAIAYLAAAVLLSSSALSYVLYVVILGGSAFTLTSLAVSAPVALLERKRWFAAPFRSIALAKGHRWAILGVVVTGLVILVAVGSALESLLVNGIVGSILPRDIPGVVVAFSLSQGLEFMLISPLFAAFIFLLYLDLRTRSEPFTPDELAGWLGES